MRSIATAAILLLKAANHASHSFAPPAAKSSSSFSAAVARQVTTTRLPTTSPRARGVRLSALTRDLSSLTVVELRGLLARGSRSQRKRAEDDADAGGPGAWRWLRTCPRRRARPAAEEVTSWSL